MSIESAIQSNHLPGLISFRMDWLDLLAVHRILKNLLQHHSSKAPVLWCSAFFRVQLSHLYMTAGKTIALTIWTFVGKVMSQLFNVLSRFVIAFLPSSKCLRRRQWQPTPVLLPGKSHGRRSLVSCSPWGRYESDMTERLHFHFHFHALEKEMATHSSVLAWRIPGVGEPGGLLSLGSHRVGHD